MLRSRAAFAAQPMASRGSNVRFGVCAIRKAAGSAPLSSTAMALMISGRCKSTVGGYPKLRRLSGDPKPMSGIDSRTMPVSMPRRRAGFFSRVWRSRVTIGKRSAFIIVLPLGGRRAMRRASQRISKRDMGRRYSDHSRSSARGRAGHHENHGPHKGSARRRWAALTRRCTRDR